MHSASESFSALLSLTLRGKPAIAALGPLYAEDPAVELLAPFRRSADATGWRTSDLTLAPEWTIERARSLRREAAVGNLDLLFEDSDGFRELEEWTRAGLLLGVCQARGVNYRDRGLIRVPWRLRGTVTGRFGTHSVRGDGWTFNPLSLSERDRRCVVPRSPGRGIAVLDFRAMDLCSMISLVPGLSQRYHGAGDPHLRTAELLSAGGTVKSRDDAKLQVFVHAYGGNSYLSRDFERLLPELSWIREKRDGEGARLVQSQSARAFRAALSAILPEMLGEELLPLFTVHDELALEYDLSHESRLSDIASAMSSAASSRIGVGYSVSISTGMSYDEAKNA